jgi:hypothetical protein
MHGLVVRVEMVNGAERIGTLLKQPDDGGCADPGWLHFSQGTHTLKIESLQLQHRISCCE